MSGKIQVLFADGEPNVLNGLRRMLHPMRGEWGMTFVASGRSALETIETHPFDVVVSEMQMPDMDGAELLNGVRARCPSAVRIILSGHTDAAMILRSVGAAHQFLAKPCDADSLRATVARSCALRTLFADEQLRAVVTGIKSLPTVPALYAQLLEVLASPDCSTDEIARIVGSDVGMTAKILQLANSAFFGLPRRIEGLSQAVIYLGVDTVRAVTLTAGAFSEFEHDDRAKAAAAALYADSMRTGVLSGKIAKTASDDRKLFNGALTAGMLREVGRLVLATASPEQWGDVTRNSREQQVPLDEIERAVFGVSHAELGAYLLGLWGLPDPVVEAVAYHHRPSECVCRSLAVLTPVHVADALVHEAKSAANEEHRARVDMGYLEAVGVVDHLPQWRELAQSVSGEETERSESATYR